MGSRSDLHFDCGLVNVGDASYVNAALQIFFHVPEVVGFLRSDNEHRKSCRSLLCVSCALFRLMSSLQDNKHTSPVFFVRWWSGIFKTLPESLQHEDVASFLHRLVTNLRLEHVNRAPNSNNLLQPYLKTLSSILFRGVKHVEVICSYCDCHSEHVQEFFSVDVQGEGDTLIDAIHKELHEGVHNVECSSCCMNSQWKPMRTTLPPYLLVQATGFKLKLAEVFKIKVEEENYELMTCAMKTATSGAWIFLSACADGTIRLIQDLQVKRISLATFLQIAVPSSSPVTFLFSRSPPPPSSAKPLCSGTENRSNEVTHNCPIAPRQRSFKVVAFPKPVSSKILMKGISGRRSIGCQTNPIVVPCKEIGIQNDLLDFDKLKTQQECKFRFWTNLNVEDFEALYNLMGGDSVVMKLKQKYQLRTPQKKNIQTKISGRNRFLLFLIRLRQGLTLEQLAFAFKLSVSYAGEIFYVMTGLVYGTLKGLSEHMFVTAAEQRKNKPKVMRPFKNLRVILDGVSFFHETPSNFEQQGNTWSSYKHHNVTVVIVGCSCQGATIFCSEGFEGSMSDKAATVKSGLIKLLHKNDAIMVDKGFELSAELEQAGVTCIKPPMKKKGRYFTKEEETMTRAIAAARIYIEHVMADIKDNALLRGVIPMLLLPILSKLVFIAAFMRNFNPSRIQDVSLKAAQAAGVGGMELEEFLYNV